LKISFLGGGIDTKIFVNRKNFPISENALLFLAPKNKNKQFSFLFLSFFLPPSSQGISCNTPAPAPAPAAMMTEEKFWEAAVCGRFGELKEILCHVLCCLCVPCLNTLLLPHPFPPSHKTPSGARHLGARQKLWLSGYYRSSSGLLLWRCLYSLSPLKTPWHKRQQTRPRFVVSACVGV